MKIEIFNTCLTPFKTDVNFHVMLPDGYDTHNKRYPVLYFHDGQDVFYDEESVSGESLRYAQYYSNFARFLPSAIIVAIDCPLNNTKRTAQYTPYTKSFEVKDKNFEPFIEGKGNEYLKWVVDELKPWIDVNYLTRPEREFTGIGGYSTASMLSFYTLFVYPDVFTRMISLSGSYYIWMDCLKETMAKSNLGHVKYIYLDVGTDEYGRITTKEQYIEGNNMIYEYLNGCGFDEMQVKYCIFPGEKHKPSSWRQRFPDALRWAFQDF
jgi:predicted alpha/beta superfamily hydrolase